MFLNDREIAQRCKDQDNAVIPYMQPGKPMIAPFLESSCKVIKTPDETPLRVPSFGLSSFGYDVRLADDFKIFTPNDPWDGSHPIDLLKVDDEKDYKRVESQNGRIIIPAQGFLLGRTEEYLRIPRDIVVLCVGKCLAGSTRITNPSTGEILPMADTFSQRLVHALDTVTGELKQMPTEGLINNGILQMSTLTTQHGHRITATPSHPIRSWNGWKHLSELQPGDRIAVSRREPFVGTGYVSIAEAQLLGFMTADGQCRVPKTSPTFTKSDTAVMDAFKEAATALGFVISERTPNSVRLVNRKQQGGTMEENRAHQWLQSHGLAVKSKEKFVAKKIQTANKEAVVAYLSALFTCDGSVQLRGASKETAVIEYYTTSERLAEELRIMLKRFGLYFMLKRQVKKFKEREFNIFILRTTDVRVIRAFYEQIGFIPGSVKARLMAVWYDLGSTAHKSNYDTLPPEAWGTLDTIMDRLKQSYASINVHPKRQQSVPIEPFRRLGHVTNDKELLSLVDNDVVWDTVESVVPSVAQVAYDYTVPELHNFVANGVIVHNSTYARLGIHVLVTPLEPEWEGHVVLEIFNSNPRPVILYVGAGITQFMFAQGNPPWVSYKDRSGKYMGQTGVTTAKL